MRSNSIAWSTENGGAARELTKRRSCVEFRVFQKERDPDSARKGGGDLADTTRLNKIEWEIKHPMRPWLMPSGSRPSLYRRARCGPKARSLRSAVQ